MVDLQAAHAELQEELEEAAMRVLRSGWYVLGSEVAAFEEEFATWLGLPSEAAVAVGSGTDALHLALWACMIGPGDEVVVPSHTAVATVAAVELSGARPVFADIHPETFTINPQAVEAVITPQTRAVIAVHLYGQAADLNALQHVVDRRRRQGHDFWLIEDCAQAHGATHHGQLVGTIGDLGCFSFYPTKNLGAAGDAGMVVSQHPNLAERVRLLRQYGWQPAGHSRYISSLAGTNSRLDELQAALLRVKLRHLERWNQARQRLADIYDKLLADCGEVTVPLVAPGNSHVYHLYVVRTQQRDRLMARLASQGIASAIHYPVPVHLQAAYQHLAPGSSKRGTGYGRLVETEKAAGEILSLPLYPQLQDEQVVRVAFCTCRSST